MKDKILELTKRLIEIESTAANREKLDMALSTAISELAGIEYFSFESEGKPSLLFGNGDKGLKKYRIILNAHLDVVEGEPEQFKPYESEGKLFGRGAFDMKGAAAAMILLFKEIHKDVDYPLGLQITTDEEIGGVDGTGYQMKNGISADFAITGEGTNFDIVFESKVRMLLKLTARGKSSHGAYPWLGENAIFKMQKAISRFHDAFPLPQSEYDGTTLNITSIGTNNKDDNKTPDQCEALIDARVAYEDQDDLLDSIKKTMGEEIEVDVVMQADGHKSDPKNKYTQKLASYTRDALGKEIKLRRAHGSSDARYFTSAGGQGVEFGPAGFNHHAQNEWVEIESLNQYYFILKNFLLG